MFFNTTNTHSLDDCGLRTDFPTSSGRLVTGYRRSRVGDWDWAIRRDGLGAFHGCRHLQDLRHQETGIAAAVVRQLVDAN